ncbi:hypothetical protein WR25_03174, partial [Diploscapter pachys]
MFRKHSGSSLAEDQAQAPISNSFGKRGGARAFLTDKRGGARSFHQIQERGGARAMFNPDAKRTILPIDEKGDYREEYMTEEEKRGGGRPFNFEARGGARAFIPQKRGGARAFFDEKRNNPWDLNLKNAVAVEISQSEKTPKSGYDKNQSFSLKTHRIFPVILKCKAQIAPNVSITPRKNPRPSTSAQKIRERISDYMRKYASPEVNAKLAPLREAVKEYGDIVKKLKESNSPKEQLDRAISELKNRKKLLEEAEVALAPHEASFDRAKLDDLLKRRFFFEPSFAIYGPQTGLYDFGPMGAALKANLVQEWRKHFILEDQMLEVDCSCLTPEPVLKASGHLERFSDWMVKDVKTGDCFRADHLIKNSIEKLLADKKTSADLKSELQEVLARLEGFDDKDMKEVITKYQFKSPINGNDVSEPVAFNLMFPTQIGPNGEEKAFLRPETAQGIFVNFKRLLEFNQSKLPFAAAQIGLGFRNEISPRQGLIRIREFTMCEIEYFVDPKDKSHPKFKKIARYPLILFPALSQSNGQPASEWRIGDAVAQGVVNNEALAYYLVRCQQFLVKDCWDAEILTSYGWVECVGNADRACYDLRQHYKATGVKLTAEKLLPTPKSVEMIEAKPNMAIIGSQFKEHAKKIQDALRKLTPEQLIEVETELAANKLYNLKINDQMLPLTDTMITTEKYSKTVHVEEIEPSVIEPSYGIGRIMNAVLEHAFREREGDESRCFLALPPLIAPIKCSVLTITKNPIFESIVGLVEEELKKYEISYKVDETSTSLGKRYARTDEIGIPFGVTIDFESEQKPHTVTLRHAETAEQIRIQ